MRQVKKPQDFEAFYYRYVGKGEACGCAERIIDVHEFNRLAGPRAQSLESRRSTFARARAWFRRLRGIEDAS